MRSFEFARKIENGEVVKEQDERGCMGEVKAFPEARLPEYATLKSAGADFFCAKEVTIPSIWSHVAEVLAVDNKGSVYNFISQLNDTMSLDEKKSQIRSTVLKPTLVHTGIKASMEDDEVLELYNRSSNPGKLGLVLANSVGVVDADYYENPDNDGEIMFAFYNFMPWSVTLKVGDKLGQGVFKKFLRPTEGLVIKSTAREGGFGSTDN